MTPFSMLILVGFFVLLSGFFSGAETALISLNRIKLRHLAESGNPRAKLLQKLLSDSDKFFITLLIGNNLVLILCTSIFSNYLILQGKPFVEELTILVVTPLLLIFGEIIPKSLFRHNALSLAVSLAPLFQLCFRVLSPFVRILRFINDRLLWMMGQKAFGNQPLFVTKAELKYLVQESEQQGMLKPHERSMIYRIFELSEKNVKKIMTPLDRMIALPSTATITQLMNEIRKSRFSWLPVYEGDPHHFVGFVSLYDVAYEENVDRPLSEFLRGLVSVSEEMIIDDVLVTLQRKKSSMALIQDSETKTIGLITIEDLLGELVGSV